MLFFKQYGIFSKVMRKLIKLLFCSLIPFFAISQSNISYSNFSESFRLLKELNISDPDTLSKLSIHPRFFGVRSSNSKNESFSTYLLGLSFNGNILDELNFSGFYDHLNGNHNADIRAFQDSLGVYPGFGLSNNRLQINARYLANKFIKIDLGYGKQFIGHGYHSLLLSDVSSSYPYLRFTTEFGPVKYYNLYTTFINPNMVDFGRKKHAAIHYLDFAITPNINFGVFESILWQSKTEESNKGYELAYLNPVIFYRPVEFSKHSNKGNALMGASFHVKFTNSMFYAQFVLDDLNISRQADADGNYQGGFFQNKYGYQLGVKGEFKCLKYLLEYNQVQPYTYGHRTILQNYSHMNQALAHPLGANLKEWINILEINNGKWNYKVKTIFTQVGLDSLDTHYGQNIFAADYDASTGGQYSYGNFNGQGVATTIFVFEPEVSFSLKWFDVFGSIYFRTKKSDLIDQTLMFYSLGLRTFLFSPFQHY